MNIVQTLYISPEQNPFNDNFGWAAAEYHLMSWALSCLQLRKLYPRVELHANARAAHLLIDTLGLPYSDVHLTHDRLVMSDSRLWALSKIYTYSLQQEPFLHVDGDVFLYSRFTPELLQGELIAQNFEEATEFYVTTQQQLKDQFTYFPPCVKADFASTVPIRAVNAGILGGNNVGFINEYARQAIEYVDRNVDRLAYINNVDRFNVFFEQHLFYSLAREQGVPISVFFSHYIKDNEYIHLGDFHEVPGKQSYLHLMGHLKKDRYTCVQMAAQLRELYPEYYYKIVALFQQKKLSFFIDYGFYEDTRSMSDYLIFKQQAQDRYRSAEVKGTDQLLARNAVVSFNLSSFELYARTSINAISDVSLQAALTSDYERFVLNIGAQHADSTQRDFLYLYGRDLEAANWCNHLFFSETEIGHHIIVRCQEAAVIESEYDWSRLLNHYTRVGVKYYLEVELTKGRYFNLFVPEVYGDGISLFDIDELEKTILDHLATPVTVSKLLEIMRGYADEEVRQQYQTLFDGFILELVKQLVVRKAVRPFTTSIS